MMTIQPSMDWAIVGITGCRNIDGEKFHKGYKTIFLMLLKSQPNSPVADQKHIIWTTYMNYVGTLATILLTTDHCISPTPLTLTLPGPSAGVSGSLDSYCSLKPLCSGMGEVVPARTSPTLLPPSPRTVLSLSCFKVLQCINCRD